MYGGKPNLEIDEKYVDRERMFIPKNFMGGRIRLSYFSIRYNKDLSIS
jgi:hypothetical protein